MNAMRRIVSALLLAAAAWGLAACSTPEDKVERYTGRGQSLMKEGDLVKARLEFPNALQINPSAVRALFGLATVAERTRDWPGAYQLFTKVVELQPSNLDAIVKVGRLQLASGQLDKALESAQAASSLQPDNADVLGLRAAVFLKLGESDKAVSLANQALAKNPHHVDSLVVLASERLHARDAEGAVAFLDRALAPDERNVSLQILKMQALETLDRLDAAEAVLHKLVSMFPAETGYRELLASFYVKHKQPAKAEAEYRALVAANPKSTGPKLQLVRFLDTAQGVEAAAAELEKFSRAEPGSTELKLALAAVRQQQKNDAAAIALWNEVIAAAGDTDPAGIRARGALASYQLAHKDSKSAKLLIEQMLAKDARDQQALYLRAGIAMDERRLDDAVVDLRGILRDAPDAAGAQLLLARTYELQGARDLAMQHYADAAKTGRFAPAFGMPYAEQLVRAGRGRQAEGVLREVLRVAPAHVPALRMLAGIQLRAGDLAAAQAVADELAKIEGAQPTAIGLQGAVQLARGDFSGGIASARRAYELAPGEAQAIVSVVRSYLAAGKPREALSFLQAVVAASPANQPARVVLGQLLARTGNVPAAVEALEAAIRIDPKQAAPYQALVAVHLANHHPESALEASSRGLQSLPGDFGLRLARASTLEALGKMEDAISIYEALLTEQPNAVIVANNLASLLADNRKDPASLRRAYDIAQRFRSTDLPLVKDTVGWTMHLEGKHKEADELLKSASTQVPDLAVIQYHYGMNLLALNNVPAARQALRRSLDLAAKTPFAQADEARKALQNL
jgi:cellulose synthase operon protein C